MAKTLLKPESVKIMGDIDNLNANIVVNMVYANWADHDVSAEFALPVDPDFIVSGLTVRKANEIIETKIMER